MLYICTYIIDNKMANFVNPKQRVKEGKVGAPTKSGQARTEWLAKQRATPRELDLIKDLLEVLRKRRQITSTMDMIMYLVEKETTHQDAIRVISSVDEE